MIARNHRTTAQPVRMAPAARDGQRSPLQAESPGFPLLDPELRAVPSLGELERIVFSKAERMYPEVPQEAVARAAHQGAEAVLKHANPRVAIFLPDLALRETRAIIGLYIALGSQNHLRAVA
ncbi:MAG: hypothetical protein ACRDHN_04270 [Thermomicrobiales bacterium]